MDQEILEELYLSFAGIFRRPRAEIANHLEELVDLWSEEISVPPEVVAELREFCSAFPVGEARENALWEEYIPLFETGQVEAPPYASVYFNGEGRVMGQETKAVLDFYAACGYGIGGERRELPDHLSVELEFVALLVRDGSWETMESFRSKHLLPFLKVILPKIQASGRRVYRAVAVLLEYWQVQA